MINLLAINDNTFIYHDFFLSFCQPGIETMLDRHVGKGVVCNF